MIAQSAPAMEQQRALSLTFLISEVHVVQPPRRIHARRPGVHLLLPVQPPEVDALPVID
jgi:hypothetical protein